MHSRFFSALIINFFYIDYLNYGYILVNEGNEYAKFCRWFPAISVDSLNRAGDWTFTPFYQNLKTLVQKPKQTRVCVVLAASPLNLGLQIPAADTALLVGYAAQ
ncbi:MAG: hypothetical protein IPN33_25825 [Saprospiraceae bacterium]|nr:hypothetical protein [Saprospiraceae bacterium]